MGLLQEVSPLPVQHTESARGRASPLAFAEVFVSVDEEWQGGHEVAQHVRDLFLEYQRANPPIEQQQAEAEDEQQSSGGAEKYEKSQPRHGDEMFHNFISRIQKNPGQILRWDLRFLSFLERDLW